MIAKSGAPDYNSGRLRLRAAKLPLSCEDPLFYIRLLIVYLIFWHHVNYA